ncbi:MAG: AmmeMemoRadiSam system protein A [Gemmatimonadota bacterium]|nr:MAG: AmmeMemoRadiSam system protein A [Gemmatimonadota bacterium]
MDNRDLLAEDKRSVVRLARRTLEEFLGGVEPSKPVTDSPALRRPCATFVTLRRRDSGELRGCRGEVHARYPLVDSVVRMAIAAATDDPRFPVVTREELPDLQIEISALTPLEPIEPGEVVVGRHGLMISKGLSSGLLLPQAAVHYGWDREMFLCMLCRKAGLPDDAWKAGNSRLLAFEAEVWGEE